VRQQMSLWEGLLVPALLQAKSQEAVVLPALPFCLHVHAKSDKVRFEGATPRAGVSAGHARAASIEKLG